MGKWQLNSYVTGPGDKTPHASLTHHAASSSANQSQALEVADKDEEPTGERWDDEEDWGRLEVEFNIF